MAVHTTQSWTPEMEHTLVEIWSDNRCLYAVSDSAFSNRDARMKVINIMEEILGVSGREISRRMTTLRTQYTRLLKQPPSGSGTKMHTSRQMWVLKALAFLEPHVKARNSISNLKSVCAFHRVRQCSLENSNELENVVLHPPILPLYLEPVKYLIKITFVINVTVFVIDLLQDSDDTQNDEQGDGSTCNPTEQEPSEIQMQTQTKLAEESHKPSSSTEVHHSKRKKMEDDSKEINQAIKSVIRKLETEQDDDQDALFGKFIAGELRSITDGRKKIQLKMTIQNEIAKARLSLLSGVNEL
nr:uncharacterized protein LOC129272387 [Lytechinus pictus]